MFWLEQFIHLYWVDYLFIGSIILGLVLAGMCFRLAETMSNWFPRIFGIFLIASCLCFAYALFIEPNILQTKLYSLDSDKLELTTPIRLVVIGDLQARARIAPSWLKYVSHEVTRLDPDYIIWVGDLVEQRIEPLRVYQPFSNMEANIAKLAILGNHDYRLQYRDPINLTVRDRVENILNSTGFTVLENKTVFTEIDNIKIQFVGTPDRWSAKTDYQYLNQAVATVSANLTIMIAHQPETILENPQPELYDLNLAGHCHGGQVSLGVFDRLIGLPHVPDGCISQPEFVEGLFEYQGHQLLVTPGIGSQYLRMRFGVPPEISILEIY